MDERLKADADHAAAAPTEAQQHVEEVRAELGRLRDEARVADALITDQPLRAALECARIGSLRLHPNSVVILMGLPGSGKSTAAAWLHEVHGFSTLGSEAVTQALYGKVGGLAPESYAYAARIFRRAARALAEDGQTLVLDSPHFLRERRNQMREVLRDLAEVHLVRIARDVEQAFEGASGRAHSADAKDPRLPIERGTFDLLRAKFEEPDEDEHARIIHAGETLAAELDQLVASLKKK